MRVYVKWWKSRNSHFWSENSGDRGSMSNVEFLLDSMLHAALPGVEFISKVNMASLRSFLDYLDWSLCSWH